MAARLVPDLCNPNALPISSNLRPAVACRARAGGHGADRPGYAKSGQGKKRTARLCRSSKLALEMKFGGPGRRGLGARGRPGPGDLASEVTHLPACLLGKQTRLRVFLSATGDARRMGRFHR